MSQTLNKWESLKRFIQFNDEISILSQMEEDVLEMAYQVYDPSNTIFTYYLCMEEYTKLQEELKNLAFMPDSDVTIYDLTLASYKIKLHKLDDYPKTL